MCDDINATVAELSARGADIPGPVTDEGFGLVTAIRLPGGESSLGISTVSSSRLGTFAPSGGTEKWRSEPREDILNGLWTNLRRLWMMLAVGAAYAYELRQSGQVVSTGRLTMEDQLAPGDELTVAGVLASVTELRWVGGESRLLLEPVSSPSRSSSRSGFTMRAELGAVVARLLGRRPGLESPSSSGRRLGERIAEALPMGERGAPLVLNAPYATSVCVMKSIRSVARLKTAAAPSARSSSRLRNAREPA
jgi:hypothetical protein